LKHPVRSHAGFGAGSRGVCDPALLTWYLQAKCDEVRKQKELALAAKSKAENDYANARTQQVRCASPVLIDIPALHSQGAAQASSSAALYQAFLCLL